MDKADRTLILQIHTGALTDREEDALVAALLRVATKHGVAHVEIPLRSIGA